MSNTTTSLPNFISNFKLKISDSHELAASAVNYLLHCDPVYLDSQQRYPPVRLQLSFSIPGYHADVLVKSFKIFYEEVIKFKPPFKLENNL